MTMGESRMQYPAPPAIEHPELLVYRDEFPILQRKTYLNSCSLGALSRRSMQGMELFMELWNEWGAHAWYDLWLAEIVKARKKFASLIGAQEHEIAIAPNVSTALSSIASALDYTVRNKVVMSTMDFPTLGHQWLVKEFESAYPTDHHRNRLHTHYVKYFLNSHLDLVRSITWQSTSTSVTA